MNRDTFLKELEELTETVKAGGSIIDKKEIDAYFDGNDLNDEAISILCEYLKSKGIVVTGFEDDISQASKRSAVSYYEEEIADLEPEDDAMLRKLVKNYFEGSDDGEELIMSLLPRVAGIAGEYRESGVAYGDLIQEGNMGLIEFLDGFQGKEEDFLQEMEAAVKASVAALINQQADADTAGQGLVLKANRLSDATQVLAEKLCREPTVDELAQYLKMTSDEIREIMKISLDALSVAETDMITEDKGE